MTLLYNNNNNIKKKKKKQKIQRKKGLISALGRCRTSNLRPRLQSPYRRKKKKKKHGCGIEGNHRKAVAAHKHAHTEGEKKSQ